MLGGGLGILGRIHGTLSRPASRAEVVLASGEIVRRRPATTCCGRCAAPGQARFGVVTELTFATVEPPASTAFELLWAPEALPAVLARLAALGARMRPTRWPRASSSPPASASR